MDVGKDTIERIVNAQISNNFKLFTNKNINLIRLNDIDQRLMNNFVQINSVTSKKDLPDTLEIQIQERKPAMVFNQNNNWFFCDKNGLLFKQINEESATSSAKEMAVIRNSSLNNELEIGDIIADKKFISAIFDLESNFNSELKILVKEMTINPENRLDVKTSEGWEAYFNLNNDLNWQFTKLKIVLDKKVPPEKRGSISYIDLRFENVYIFPETYNQDSVNLKDEN
jgi:cell division septal protein FtsQ